MHSSSNLIQLIFYSFFSRIGTYLIRQTQNIIHTRPIILRQSYQGFQRNLAPAGLITCITRLAAIQIRTYIFLLHVPVFPQISQTSLYHNKPSISKICYSI